MMTVSSNLLSFLILGKQSQRFKQLMSLRFCIIIAVIPETSAYNKSSLECVLCFVTPTFFG